MSTNLDFVRWVKQQHPAVYRAALAKVASQSRLGGLGSNLADDLTFDPGSIDVGTSEQASIDSAVSSPTADSSSSDWGSSISSVVNSLSSAISNVAPAIVTTDAQLKAININAQRAQTGQPLITGASLLTGSTLASGDGIVIIGGIALLALLLSKGGSSKAA
jgi:hypothetical protein